MARDRSTASMLSFLAPKSGWIANQNIAQPETMDAAWRLTNFFPTATGSELRRGSSNYAKIGTAGGYVRSFLRYKNGGVEKLFGAVDEGIYDITAIADNDVSPAPSVAGTLSGDWRSTQFATSGGVFLVAVNGADDGQVYNGDVWFQANEKKLTQIAFDGQTGPFQIGQTVTGATSGATAIIVAVSSNGVTGYLLVRDASEDPFEDNEALSTTGGAATVNGEPFVVFLGVSGIDTSRLDFVWAYKNQLFFIEKDTMNAWYAEVDALGGVLKRFPLGGVFPLGGSLMFGAAWSLESSGQGGLSEQCIFVTTEGEVAVFQGIRPSLAETWSKVGTYRIGKPLGPKAWFRSGGDIIIATDIGMIPLSQAINRDIAALSAVALSYPIETAWNDSVRDRRSQHWDCIMWPERQMVLVALPTMVNELPEMFVANARTGAWASFTNWDGACLEVFQGRLFFGSKDGRIVEAYVTGADRGETFTGVYVPLFIDAGAPASSKVTLMTHAVIRCSQPAIMDVSMQFDYGIEDLVAPPATPVEGVSVWGEAKWGEAKWGGGQTKKHQAEWFSTGGIGYAFAPCLQITSGSIAPLEMDIVRLDSTFEAAEIGS